MKLVSIIITTHKGSDLITKALESVLRQTYEYIEIIVVDDNGIGTEEQLNTQKKLSEYIKKKQIKYICHEENKNGAAARNTGFKNSNGQYIGFLDDDDIYYPKKVEFLTDALEKLDEEWGLAYCSVELTYGDKRIIRRASKSGNLLFDLLIHRVVIGTGSFLVRRTVYKKLNGFDEGFKRHQDFEFTARIASQYNIKAVDKVGYVYYRNTSRNTPKTIEVAQKHRRYYIDKMLPLIQKFNIREQRIIIYSNSLEVTSNYLRKGKLKKFVSEFNSFVTRWDDKVQLDVFRLVLFMKIKQWMKRKKSLLLA